MEASKVDDKYPNNKKVIELSILRSIEVINTLEIHSIDWLTATFFLFLAALNTAFIDELIKVKHAYKLTSRRIVIHSFTENI